MKPLLLSLLILNLAACSSMQPVSLRDVRGNDAPAEIREGDRVEVVTKDGDKFEFDATQINASGVGGKFGFIPYERMRSLSVLRPDSPSADNLGWLWAILGTAAAIALISNADSVSVCSPGPCPQPNP